MQAQPWLRAIQRGIKSNSTTILSVAAVAGVAATAVLAVRNHREASMEFADAEVEFCEANDVDPLVWEGFNRVETAKIVWKSYIPVAVTGFATVACIVGANQIGLRRNAAILGAYTLADATFREYKDEVVRQIGEAKSTKVRDEIVKRKVEDHPVTESQVIITGGGDQRCFDSLTGRYFKSDIEKIRQAQNDLNGRILRGDMYASQNDFYDLVGLEHVAIGEDVGWNVEHPLEVVFTAILSPDNTPTIAVGYENNPIYNFGRVF